MNGTMVTIGDNHGHVLTVSKADVLAGAQKTYNIQGTSLHPHTVIVTAAEFAQLAANTPVSKMSSNDGHAHPITIVCV